MQDSIQKKNDQSQMLRIPKRLQNKWKKLFTSQLYCIGIDIQHKENLLLKYGFTRKRPPNPDDGSSQYSFCKQDRRVIMWGFGMMFSTKNDGLFLWRHEFEPKFIKVNALIPNVWSPDQLPQRTIPKTPEQMHHILHMLVESMKWLENYEKWIDSVCGESYRDSIMEEKHTPNIPYKRLDEGWHDLFEKFSDILR